MKRMHLIISGDVQGVGYRAWARRTAKTLHVTGWVKNRPDGSVELIAEGDTQPLQTLMQRCRRGPDVSWVASVQDDWADATGEFMSFSVLY